MQNDLKNIIESLLFVADNPIDVRMFKRIIPDADTKEIRQTIIELMEEYDTRQGGFILTEVAGGFQFRSRPEYKEWIKKMIKPAPIRLSKAAMETLAIIAYHQPIIRSDVERIRGVDSGAIMRGLLERKLVRILGKKDIPGRPLIYATTKRFLEIFNLKSLSDMPTLKEIQEFGQAEVDELAAGLAEQQGQAEGEPPGDSDTETPDNEDSDAPEQQAAAQPDEETDLPEQEETDTPEAAEGTVPTEQDVAIPERVETTASDQTTYTTEEDEPDPIDQAPDNQEDDGTEERSSDDSEEEPENNL